MKPKPPRAHRLTERQRRFALELVRAVVYGPVSRGATYTAAARLAGYRDARRLGSRTRRKPWVRDEMRRLFEAYGAWDWTSWA